MTTDPDPGGGSARDDDARRDPGDEPRDDPSARRTVTRVGPGDGGDRLHDGRVTTGVLAADSSARTELDRRRRWLVGGAVLGAVVVLAFVLGVTLAANIAEDQARADARLAAAEAAFASQVVDRAEDYEPLARTTAEEASTLRTRLEDHLVADSAVDAELTAAVEESAATLTEQVARIATLTERELPQIDPRVDLDDGQEALRELDQLRADAMALVEDAEGIEDVVGSWSAAVVTLDEALAAHVAVVEQQPETTDPDELIESWRSERAPLRALADQARATAREPGLRPWARAHLVYARNTLAFIDEAIPLLRDGRLDRYNERYREVFGGDDPFGFTAAARAGATSGLESAPVTTVIGLGERAMLLTEQLERTERTVAERFTDDA